MFNDRKEITGTIERVDRARINGNDVFALILEEQPLVIYTGSENARLSVARAGDRVRMSVEKVADVGTIFGFSLAAKPARIDADAL